MKRLRRPLSRSRRREPGTAAQARAGARGPGRRRPAYAPRSSDGAAEAPEVGVDLAAAWIRGLVLLVATVLPLPHAAGVRRAAGGGEGAALRVLGGALHHLSEGRPVRRPLRRLPDDLLAGLDVRRPRPLPARAAQDRALRPGGDG